MAKRRCEELILLLFFCLLKFTDQETILKKSSRNTTAAIAEAFIWSEFDRHGVQSLLPNIRSRVFDKYLDSLDEKEYKKAISWMSKTEEILEDLLLSHMAVIPSEEFLKSNPNHEGLFNVSLTPEKSFAKQLLINLTAVHNYKDPRGRDLPPLSLVCALPSIETRTVKYVLDNGIDVNSKTRSNDTALMSAADRGNLPVVKLLIEEGAILDDGVDNLMPSNDDSLCDRFIQIFSDKKPPVPNKSTIRFSPFAIAVSQGHVEVTKYLLDHGADLIVKNQVLLLSFPQAMSEDLNMLNLLLQYGLSVNATDFVGRTMLHKTAANGDLEMSKLLLKYQAYVKATDYFGWTPLHFAALYAGYDSKPLMNLLLDNGGDINAETDGGFTPLNLLEAGRDKSFLKYLKDYLPLTSTNNSLSRPPSRDLRQAELVRLFLDRGANVDHQDHLLGWSTLHWAAAIGDTPAVKLLVEEYRANVTTKSKMGWTPSYTAKHFNMTEISKYLARAESTQPGLIAVHTEYTL